MMRLISGVGSRRIAFAISALLLSSTVVFGATDADAAPACPPPTQDYTDGDDTLVGTDGQDVLFGGHGDDEIVGLGGDDFLCGGAGDDVILGGDGNDIVEGGSGADALDGLAGDDEIEGGSGIDLLVGEGGDDALLGGGGLDIAYYGFSSGSVAVDLATNSAWGEGRDVVRAESAIGSDFDDIIAGNAFPNYLEGGKGNDLLDGRGDFDFLMFVFAKRGVDVDLSEGVSRGYGRDDVVRIEAVEGSSYDDVLVGSDVRNELDGGDGRDFVNALGATDVCLRAERARECERTSWSRSEPPERDIPQPPEPTVSTSRTSALAAWPTHDHGIRCLSVYPDFASIRYMAPYIEPWPTADTWVIDSTGAGAVTGPEWVWTKIYVGWFDGQGQWHWYGSGRPLAAKNGFTAYGDGYWVYEGGQWREPQRDATIESAVDVPLGSGPWWVGIQVLWGPVPGDPQKTSWTSHFHWVRQGDLVCPAS